MMMMLMMMMMVVLLVLGTEEIGSEKVHAPQPPPSVPLPWYGSAEREKAAQQMQLQNYQEKLLAPVPSHPRASLSDPYRPHLIPLLPPRGLQRTNFRLLHRAHSFAQTNEKASLTMEDGPNVSLLGACNQSDLLPVLPEHRTSLTC